MKKFLMLFGSTLLLSAVGSASIACPTATYDVYTSNVNAAGGCMISTTLFNNFTFTGISAGNPVQLTAANVSVTPVPSPNPGFTFTLPLSAGVNQANDVTLGYNATAGIGSSFTGANLFQTAGFAGTGSATVKDTFCLGGFLIGCSGANGRSLQTQQNSITLSPTATTPISATFVDISKDILTTSNGAGGMASLSVASNTLNLTPNPEPVSLLLMGSGLLALGVIGRRARKA